MARFTLTVQFDLPSSDEWKAGAESKELEHIAQMAADQLDRWAGAATVESVTISDADTVRVTA